MATLWEFDGDKFGPWLGSDDTFSGTDNESNALYGDVTGYLYFGAQGGNDTLTGGDNSTNQLSGDAYQIWSALGGNDILTGGANSDNTLVGDAISEFIGSAQGGDDVLIGGNNSTNTLVGDSGNTFAAAQGGDDTLTGGANSTNYLDGDFDYMSGATGGDDVLTGGANSTNYLFGDTRFEMFGGAQGGDDTLIGGDDSTNYLYGDAGLVSSFNGGGVQCGDDTLIAGDNSTNYLYGDSERLSAAQGGDDVLISATGSDHMWGDAETIDFDGQGGFDTFVFGQNNGTDYIYDFEQGKDMIDVSALYLFLPDAPVPAHKLPPQAHHGLIHTHFSGFGALDSNGNDVLDDGDVYVSVDDGNTVIDLGAAQLGASGVDVVTVINVTGLAEADFFFG